MSHCTREAETTKPPQIYTDFYWMLWRPQWRSDREHYRSFWIGGEVQQLKYWWVDKYVKRDLQQPCTGQLLITLWSVENASGRSALHFAELVTMEMRADAAEWDRIGVYWLKAYIHNGSGVRGRNGNNAWHTPRILNAHGINRVHFFFFFAAVKFLYPCQSHAETQFHS